VSRAADAQIDASRRLLADAAERLPGTRVATQDRLYAGHTLLAERLGGNVGTTDVREPVGTTTRVLLHGVTVYPSDGVEALVAAISRAQAVGARASEVRHAA